MAVFDELKRTNKLTALPALYAAARDDLHTNLSTAQIASLAAFALKIEDGGSLFWVVKGTIVCRQPVLDIATLGEGKQSRCEITLEPKVIRTAPMARRPFQGWRYFEPKDAPVDLTDLDAGEAPEELVRQLRELGAW